MKVLVAHNAYQQRGGEDAVVAAETQLVEAHGHAVVRYERQNDELQNRGPLSVISAGLGTVWASKSFREVKALLAREKPDVAHFHNTFPLISPACYYACAEAGVPVAQTLHNYRLLCPAATFLRDGKVCKECLGRGVPWPGVVHNCYRRSRPATAAVGAMLAVHRTMRTWTEKVDVYIALSEFARQQFIEGGLPPEKIMVKPNFVSLDPEVKRGPGDYALYVGRLSEEKGLRVLLAAWSLLRQRIPLRIAGDGPIKEEMTRESKQKVLDSVEFLGHVDPAGITGLMQGARFLVFPSVWFETFGLAIVEAFACGLPVIASRLGAMAEIVQDGRTGLHFTPGDSRELAAKIDWAWNHPEEILCIGRAARKEYEAKYTAEENYRRLMDIYQRVLEHPHGAVTSLPASQPWSVSRTPGKEGRH